MKITQQEIAAIAAWGAALPGFGRDDPQTATRIRRIVGDIQESGRFGCDIVVDDGLSNYFVLFSFAMANVDPRAPYPNVKGILFYLSSCGPFGVAGRSRRCVGEGFEHLFEPLKLEMLISTGDAASELERETFAIIAQCGYRILTRDEISDPIPAGVVLDPECRGGDGDRIFDFLFSETD